MVPIHHIKMLQKQTIKEQSVTIPYNNNVTAVNQDNVRLIPSDIAKKTNKEN